DQIFKAGGVFAFGVDADDWFGAGGPHEHPAAVGEDELYAIEPIYLFNLPAADRVGFAGQPVFQTCGDLGGQPDADPRREQFAEPAVKLSELSGERRPAYGDRLGGQEACDDAVLFGVVALDREPRGLFAAKDDRIAVDQFADELEPDGRFKELDAAFGGNPVDHVGRCHAAGDALAP